MTLSIWRWAHLALALVSGLFLIILSITGVILAIGAVESDAYRTDKNITLAETIPILQKNYSEITEISVDHKGYVTLQGTDLEGNPVNAWINPKTGAIYEPVKNPSDFIQWNIALHRSLFLKETGRVLVGIVSFLLLIITITGVILIAKRQQGLRHFFAKIHKDYFWSYFHVITGRLTLIPVFLLALTGTYLFMARIGLTEAKEKITHFEPEEKEIPVQEFPLFKNTLVKDIEKLEFPFIPDDPEEFYILHLKDKSLSIHQISGDLVTETVLPSTTVWEKISLDLHTGRTNVLWAIILGIASLNILFFIYSGLAITFRRKKSLIKNHFQEKEAEFILLVGSENGSTLGFASKIHDQLLQAGHASYLTELNKITAFPKAKHLLVFTSTYGLGTAPSNATRFEHLFNPNTFPKSIDYSVIGFGSKAYPDFCAFAQHIDHFLDQYFSRALPLFTINDRSTEEFSAWVQAWNKAKNMDLGTTPALYTAQSPKLIPFEVINHTQTDPTFILELKPLKKVSFRSGDLLAIYPQNKERLYSVGKVNNHLQLVVKHHENGLGSTLLAELKPGDILEAKCIKNDSFHIPDKSKEIFMIANGTGIAPFLGMIAENTSKKKIHLYAGFRQKNSLSEIYDQWTNTAIRDHKLQSYQVAYSRAENFCYVMDLLVQDSSKFVKAMQNGATIMICGSLIMQNDVEKVLKEILGDLQPYRSQIRTDCY
jgi:sulfite reductase (NADPH) flavoprotein alpha-component